MDANAVVCCLQGCGLNVAAQPSPTRWAGLDCKLLAAAWILISLDSFYLPGPLSFSCSFPVLLLVLSYPLVQELAYIYEGSVPYIYTNTHTHSYIYIHSRDLTLPYSLYASNRFFFSWPPTFLLFDK